MNRAEALQQRKKLIRLIREWTRADVVSRLGAFERPVWLEAAQTKLDKEEEIRELVLGTSDFIVLGARWGLLGEKKSGCDERKKKK